MFDAASRQVLRYLCDLDVRLLGELRLQEVLAVFLGFDLSVQLQPADGRLRTQIPVQRLQDDINTQVNREKPEQSTDGWRISQVYT